MEENEILNIGTTPTPPTNNLFTDSAKQATDLLAQVERTLAKPKDPTPAIKKVQEAQNLIKTPEFPTISQVLGEKQPQPKTKQEAEQLASEKRIQEAVNDLKRSGTAAKQSGLLDTTEEIIPYKEVEKYVKSGMFEEVGYKRGIDNDSAYDAKQSWYGDIGRNVLGFTANTAGSFAGGMTSLGDLVYQASKYAIGTNDMLDKDGNRSFSKLIENSYDNALTRSINDFQKNINEGVGYNFRNARERDLEANNPLLNLVPFYGNGFGESVRSLGFTAGSLGAVVVSEYLTAGLGNAAVLSKGVGYVPKLAGKMAGAIKSSERIDKMIDGMKSLGILNKLDAAIDVGAAAKKLYTGYDVGLGLKLGVRPVARGVISAMSEASMEALETKENLYNELIEQYKTQHGGNTPEGKDLDEINQTVTDAANTRYMANLAIIGIGNSLTLNSLFKNLPMTQRLIGEEVQAGSRIAIEGGRFVEKSAEKAVSTWAKDPRWYKQVLGKSYDAIRNSGPIGLLAPSEAVEEGLQMVAQKATDAYYKHQYNVDDRTFNLYEAYKAIADGLKDTVTTNEGWNAMLQGMLGGTISGGIGKAIQARRESRPEYIQQQEQIKLQNIAASQQLNERFAEILDTNSIGGSISSKVFDIKTQKGIQDELHAAATEGDNYRFQNNKHSLQFNFIDTFLKNHQGEVLLEHLNDMKELAMKNPTEFNRAYGREVEGVTAGNPVETVNEMIELANENIKAKEKLDLIFVNPYTNPRTLEDAVGYQQYERYKTELRHSMSAIRDYKRRVGTLEGEMDGHGSVLNQLLDNETYQQELASIKSEIDTLNSINDKKGAARLQKQYDFIEKMRDKKATADEIRKYVMDATNVGFRDEVDGLIQKQMDIISLKQDTKRAYETYNKLIDGNGFKKFVQQEATYRETVDKIKEQEFQIKQAAEKAAADKVVADKKKVLRDKVKEALKKHNIDPVEFYKRNSIKAEVALLDQNYDLTATDDAIQAWVDNQVVEDVAAVVVEQEKEAKVAETVSTVVEDIKADPAIDRRFENLGEPDIQDFIDKQNSAPVNISEDNQYIVEDDIDEDAYDGSQWLDVGDNAPAFEAPQVEEPQITRAEVEQDIQDKVEERINTETVDSLTPARIEEIKQEVIAEVLDPQQTGEEFDAQIHPDWKGKLVFAPYGSGKSTATKKSANVFMDGDEYVTAVLRDMLIDNGEGLLQSAQPLLDDYNISRKEIAEKYNITPEELRDAVSAQLEEDILQDGNTVFFGSPYWINQDTIDEINAFDNVIAVTVDKDRQRKLAIDIGTRDTNNNISNADIAKNVAIVNNLDAGRRIELVSTPVKTYYIEDVVKSPIAVTQKKFEDLKADEKIIEQIKEEEQVTKPLVGNPLRKLLYDNNSFGYTRSIVDTQRNKSKSKFNIITERSNDLTPQQKEVLKEQIKVQRVKFMNDLAKGNLSDYVIKYGDGGNVNYGGQVDFHPDLYRRYAQAYITIQTKAPLGSSNVHPVVFFVPIENNLFVDTTRPVGRSYSSAALFGATPIDANLYSKLPDSTAIPYADYLKLHSEHMAFMQQLKTITGKIGSDNSGALKDFTELLNLKMQFTDNMANTATPIPLADVQVSNAVNPNMNTPSNIVVIGYQDGQFVIHKSSNITRAQRNDILERLSNYDASKWNFGNSQWTLNFDTVSGSPIFNRVVGRNEAASVAEYVNTNGVLPSLSEKNVLLFSTGKEDNSRRFRLKLMNKTVNGVTGNYIRIDFNVRDEELENESGNLNIEIPVDVPTDATEANIAKTIFDSFLVAINNPDYTPTYTNREGNQANVPVKSYFRDTLSSVVPDDQLDTAVEQIYDDFTVAAQNPLSIVKPNREDFIGNSVVQVSSPMMFEKVYLTADPIIKDTPAEQVEITIPAEEPKPVLADPGVETPLAQLPEPTTTEPETFGINELVMAVVDNKLDNIQSLSLDGKQYNDLQNILSNIKGKTLQEAAKLFNEIAAPNLNTTGVQTAHKLDINSLLSLPNYSSFGTILASPMSNSQKVDFLRKGGVKYIEANAPAPFTRLNESVEEELEQLKKTCF